jgi:hypothetical protein
MEEESVAHIITSSWEKVEARITIEDAMTSFLTQGLDDCGATICLAAFKLVSHVLDKGGYVRRVHKSANTPLASVLTNTEGPWVETGRDVDRHWDYSSTWLKELCSQCGVEPSLAGQWLPAAGGDGAWAARTGSGPMLMRGDIFAASRGGGAGC